MIGKVGIEIPPVGLEFEVTDSVGSSHSSSSSSALELGTLDFPGKRSDKMFGKPPPLVVVLEATVVLVSALELGTLDLPGKRSDNIFGNPVVLEATVGLDSALEMGALDFPGKRSDNIFGSPPPVVVATLDVVGALAGALVGLSVSSTQSSSSVSDTLD